MAVKDKVSDAVETARPYAERLAKDEELHDHVKNAYESARRIYEEMIGGRTPTGMAFKAARDKDVQEELRRTVQELREAGKHLQKAEESHAARNVGLLLVGIALGVLFNPATGPDTRRWIKDRMLGSEESFGQQQSGQQS